MCRAQLERARQAKEDAEREKKELADRLHKYEQDTKKAEEGIIHVHVHIGLGLGLLYMYMYTCTCTLVHVHVRVYMHQCTCTGIHVYTSIQPTWFIN